MRARYFWLLLALGVGPGPVLACEAGRVFEDRNGNGRLDAGELGLAGVSVSNGRRLVLSEDDGRYRWPSNEGRALFVIKPAGYGLPRRADGLPDFWRPAAGGANCGDFALTPQPASGQALELLVFGDPQPKSSVDVDYYARDIVEPIRARAGEAPAAALGLTLGDVVHDAPALYPEINEVTTRLGVPWLHAAGNHDIDAAAASDDASLRSFGRVYGPDSFAWEEAEATIVVLDNVIHRPGAAPSYVGGLREDQFEFLQAYLQRADKQRLLIVAAHIPFFDTAPALGSFRPDDRQRLFALLGAFPKVLLLTAHSHNQRHYFHGRREGWMGAQPLHEYNVGAACGAYWSGRPDAAGIPDATMSDGTPNGYARLSVAADGEYRLRWFVARAGDDPGLAVHAPRLLRQHAYPAFGVYANVFMGHADSRVEFRVDDGDWQSMQRVEAGDPRLLAENVADDAATQLRGFDRSPEATPSSHLWRGTLPTNLAEGEHRIEVRTFDPWRGELRATSRYRLRAQAQVPAQ